MDFAYAIAIVIARPLVLSVIDGRVLLVDPVGAAVFVRIDDRPFARYCLSKNALARRLVAVTDHPAARFARLATDDVDNRWAIIVIGAMPGLLIRAAARWIIRVAMGCTFFSPAFC
jgi:hypothetical protein